MYLMQTPGATAQQLTFTEKKLFNGQLDWFDCFCCLILLYVWREQLQALALQPAVWGISCLVLLPSSCNDSSLHSSFSYNSKVTAVTNTKRINRNLLRKESSFVCFTSSVMRKSWHMKQIEKLRTAVKIKTQDYKNWAQLEPLH